MNATYKAVASNPKAVRRLEEIKKSLRARKLSYTEAESVETITVLEEQTPRRKYSKPKPVAKETHVIVVTVSGTPVEPKPRKTKKVDLYTYQGPSETPYEYTAEDLAFFAETEKLASISADELSAVAA